MGKGPKEEATTPKPKRDFHKQPRPSQFEKVSKERFAAVEKQLQQLFGRNLREARLRAGLTQTDVANIIGTTQPYVGWVERGQRNISLSLLVRLAYAVRTDPGALLLGDRAATYNLETLLQLVAALQAHLQTMMGDQAKSLPQGEPLVIAATPFRFDVPETPLSAGRT